MDPANLITVQTLKTAVERMKSEFGELGGGTLYGSIKSDFSASDTSVIEAYFAQDGAPTPKAGDVFIVTTIVNEKTYEKSAYG